MAKAGRKDAATFVKAWESADSLADAAEKLGMKVTSLRTRAYFYRGKGVELKKFPRGGGGSPLDVAALNALIGKKGLVPKATKTKTLASKAAPKKKR